MSEQNVKYVLAKSDTIRDKYMKIYHDPIYQKKPFNYDKLKGWDKIREDGLRTAFFTGWHEAEQFYELQKIIDDMNDRTPKESHKDG